MHYATGDEISQPDGNDEGTDMSKYSSLGAPENVPQDVATLALRVSILFLVQVQFRTEVLYQAPKFDPTGV